MSISIRSNQDGAKAHNGDVVLLQALMGSEAGLFSGRSDVTKLVFAKESIDESSAHAIGVQVNSIHSMFGAVAEKLGLANRAGGVYKDKAQAGSLVAALESAAVTGAMAATSGASFLGQKTDISSVRSSDASMQMFTVTSENAPNYVGKRADRMVAAMEAFDQVQQRNAALYSMAYNYTVSLQDEFNETVWPLLTLPADQIGFGIVVNRLTVHRGLVHDVSGRAQELKKVDLCRAGVDYTVLSRKKNRAIPVHRAASADKFVAAALVAPWDYTEEGANFKTSAYKIATELSIIGLCQTDAQLSGASGAANQTDTLDPAVSLDDLFVKVGDDILKLNVYGRQGANFVFSQQDRNEDRRLAFDSKYVVIGPKTKQADGSTLVSLAALASKNQFVVLHISANGTLNTEFGTAAVYGNKVAIVRAYDNANNLLDTASSDYTDLATALSSAALIGYTLRSYKTNINMRERGDFVDRNQFTQLYEVPLLSPITYQRPVGQNGENDAADFETLVTTTRFRMKGDGVTAIFEAFERIRDFTLVPFNTEDAPSGMGAARFHVKPYCADLTDAANCIDAAALVSTLDNAAAVENVQAAIVNKLRDVAFSMYVMSEYQSAMTALGLNTDSMSLIIATDPYIRRYLTVNGDLRTLTEKFNVHLVDTLDKRFRGKIFMTFGIFDESRNQGPNILNWGNLVWAPEVVVSANMPRGEAMARETIVQPRYLFVNHLPVCAMITVKNIDQVFDESYLRVKSI